MTTNAKSTIEEVRAAIIEAETHNFGSLDWADFCNVEFDGEMEIEVDEWYGRVVRAVIQAIRDTK